MGHLWKWWRKRKIMMYDAIVTTNQGKHTYQNIEALNEQHLINKIAKDLKTEIVEIEEIGN